MLISVSIYIIDLIHKSHNAPVPYPTMHHSGQKCTHFCFELCIMGYTTGAWWDLWDWLIAFAFHSFIWLYELIEAEWRIYVSKIWHHWFRYWLVACKAPSHYLNQCWFVVNWNPWDKLKRYSHQNSNIFIQVNAFENAVWTFSLNIGFNILPLDSFLSCLDYLLGYSIGEFQTLQLIVPGCLVPLTPVCWSTFWK